MALATLVEIAQDLCASLADQDRYQRIAAAVRQLVPCEATALLRLEDGLLVPVVADGLLPETLGLRFLPSEHPRLRALLGATGPKRFTNSNLPDPFDGLLAQGGDALSRVHACMGAPLVVEGEVVGVLTVDALDPSAFDDVDDRTLAAFAGLAGAAIRTARLIEVIEQTAVRQGTLSQHLMRDARRGSGEILGQSIPMSQVRDEIELLGTSDLTALITGETGVGKELVAQAIHAASKRRDRPLIRVNCAALPESIAESELFGHLRGAFTGAAGDRAGKFEVADGGTLFLDEVGELPPTIQPKLLRVLQRGEVQRVGSDRLHHVDVRIVAATNRDLAAEVRAGRFRADLYHRLSVYPIAIPPLRDRGSDVLLLAGHFLDRARLRLGTGRTRLSAGARSALQDYDWPGNVRELEHVILRAVLRASRSGNSTEVVIDAAHLGLDGPAPVGPALDGPGPERPPHGSATGLAPVSPPLDPTSDGAGSQGIAPFRQAVDDFSRAHVQRALAASGGNWSAAATLLGMHRANLHRLARRLGLK